MSKREKPELSCFRVCQSPPLSPSLSFLTMRMEGAFSAPGWGSDLPDCLPLLCLLPLQDPTAFPVPTFQDLAGFWDLLQLSIEDVTLKFLELQQLKANSWKLLEPKVGGGPFKPRVLEHAPPQRGRCVGSGQLRKRSTGSKGSSWQVMATIIQNNHILGHCCLPGPSAHHCLSCQNPEVAAATLDQL